MPQTSYDTTPLTFPLARTQPHGLKSTLRNLSLSLSLSLSLVAQPCPTLATLWTIHYQVPLSKGFSRQEYWSGLSFPSPLINIGSVLIFVGPKFFCRKDHSDQETNDPTRRHSNTSTEIK